MCYLIDITMVQSVSRSWRAATISTKNSKTRLMVGYLEPLGNLVAVLKIFKNSTTFAIVFHSSSLHILSNNRMRITVQNKHEASSCIEQLRQLFAEQPNMLYLYLYETLFARGYGEKNMLITGTSAARRSRKLAAWSAQGSIVSIDSRPSETLI